MVKGTSDHDFGEWTHEVRTFMLARFGDQILGALTWASRQRKIVVKACGPSQRQHIIAWIDVFEEGADEEDPTRSTISLESSTHTLLSLTTDAPNGIVGNSGEGNGLEAWETIAQ